MFRPQGRLAPPGLRGRMRSAMNGPGVHRAPLQAIVGFGSKSSEFKHTSKITSPAHILLILFLKYVPPAILTFDHISCKILALAL